MVQASQGGPGVPKVIQKVSQRCLKKRNPGYSEGSTSAVGAPFCHIPLKERCKRWSKSGLFLVPNTTFVTFGHPDAALGPVSSPGGSEGGILPENRPVLGSGQR